MPDPADPRLLVKLPARVQGLERLDARQDSQERPVPVDLALSKQLVRAPDGDELGIVAVLPYEQVGTRPDLAVVDHLEGC